jgi:hypothetical protein
MDRLIQDFSRAVLAGNGTQLAATLSPVPSEDHPTYITDIWRSETHVSIRNAVKHQIDQCSARRLLGNDQHKGWTEVYIAYWKAIGEVFAVENNVSSASWTKAYDAWKELGLALHRGYSNYAFAAWTIPCLYVVGKHMRAYAIKADKERANGAGNAVAASFQEEFDPELEQNQSLRDCEQQLKRLFTLCLSDRSPLEESRKWGVYALINLLFKTYFKLNSAAMSRTILKSLSAYKGDMPPLEAFPRSQRVTFKYYEGVLSFLEEDYAAAEASLTQAWKLCHRDAASNKERILIYLIPCRLLTSHTLPTAQLLEPYPRLHRLFTALPHAIKQGNLAAFDDAIREHEDEYVKLRIYLTLERGRDVAMRNLFRRVFVYGGFVETRDGEPPLRRTRISIIEFATAAMVAGKARALDVDEVECILANMIYKGLMKGYISREHKMVVLSKAGAFPGTGV